MIGVESLISQIKKEYNYTEKEHVHTIMIFIFSRLNPYTENTRSFNDNLSDFVKSTLKIGMRLI